MIIYIENPRESTKKLLKLIREFSKVAEYKINIQKSVSFLYTNNEPSEREIKRIPCTTASKRIKYQYLGINLTREVKDLYTEIYKTLTKILKTQINRNIFVLLDWKS